MIVNLILGYAIMIAQDTHTIAPPKANTIVCKQCNHSHTKEYRLTPEKLEHIVLNVAGRPGSSVSRSSSRGYVRLAKKESTYRPTAQNPRTSAYGLFGFLNSTWKSVGMKKTDCPYCQVEAAGRYIKRRYGSISAALAHHNKKGWY